MAIPVSVIIPTRNCRDALVRHLDAIGDRLDEVAEVIAIDSESEDGTLDVLRQRLSAHRATIMSHPPGLYESWNAAIARATAPWTYVSTVSDSIDSAGLERLVAVAERFEADVVVSPPRMMQEDGVTPANILWPMHHFCDAVGDAAPPRLLSRLETVIGLCSFVTGSILGSSAGNIYRTACLQQRPFPVEFGHAGDTAWGLQNCARLRLVLLPQPVSTFCLGWQFRESDPRGQRELFLRLNRVATEALDAAGDDPEVRFALGWLRALVANKTLLWDWLASQAELVRDHQDLRDYLAQVEDEKSRSLRGRVKRLLGR
jgi:hypothetical protein